MAFRVVLFFAVALLVCCSPGYSMEQVRSDIPTLEMLLKSQKREAVVPRPVGATPASLTSRVPPAATASVTQPRSGRLHTPGPQQKNSAVNSQSSATTHRISAGRPYGLPELNSHGISGNGITPARPVTRKAHAASVQPKLPSPRVRAKAVYCVDYSANKVVFSQNSQEPLPIASITKLLTAMAVIDEMKLDDVVEAPHDIHQIPRHRVGIRSGERFTVEDLLHGMLIESGNDCAEALARAYPKGRKAGLLAAMKRKAAQIGAGSAEIHTPSGLDMMLTVGRTGGRELAVRKPNTASAREVALIASHAFQYPLISKIATLKTSSMRTVDAPSKTYNLVTNDKLLSSNLPVAGAKTGYTDRAGKCIVALFKDQLKEHMVVVLNTPNNFKAAEKIYRWAQSTF